MTINGLYANAYRTYGISTRNVQQSYRPLASGYRINSAADGPAELAISQRMRGQIAGLNKATENATQAISMTQTAEGALSSTSSILTRMQELSVQASNGTYSDADRANLDKEFQQLKSQLDTISSSTQYNGQNLLDGSLSSNGVTFQVGANGSADQRLSMTIGDMSSLGLGLDNLSIATLDGANGALKTLSGAVDTVNAQRAGLGSTQNRLESVVSNLGVTIENTTASESRIRDADMAASIMKLTQNSIQQQASLAMMSHTMTAARSNMLGLLMR